MRISVIGLGKLGSPMAAVFAAGGNEVVGADLNPAFVEALNEGRSPVDEPGLDRLVAEHAGRIRATTDVRAAAAATDATFIIVPTPSGPDGAFLNDFVIDCCREIGAAIAERDDRPLVVLTSTVMPGASDEAIIPALEAASGRRCGRDFSYCYSPEFIAIGNVINGLTRPDFLLIGEGGDGAGARLEEIYRTVTESPVARMSYRNAELTKISVNAFITMKISFANTIGEICETMPGGNADHVTRALGLDERIGRKFLGSAIGFGGPCLPRDNRALDVFAARQGVDTVIARAVDQVNLRQVDRVVRAVAARAPEGSPVAVLGLSYRPDTGMVLESQALMIATRLAEDREVVAYDPKARAEAEEEAGDALRFADSARDAIRDAGLVLVATPWREFADPELWEDARPAVVLDCWGLVDPAQLPAGTACVRLGAKDS